MKKRFSRVREEKVNYVSGEVEVTRREFNLLTKEVRKLAQAQKRTEERVEELAQAQRKSEERITRLEKAVEELAQAQRRTEESLNRLSQMVEKLAEKVEGLSDRIGFSLEDLGRELLPAYFKYHFGITVKELVPRWFEVDDVRIEINFYGSGEKDGKEIILLGESQSRIFDSSIKIFADHFKKVESVIKKDTFRFAFGFSVHPSATEIADKENIKLIATYQLRNV